MFSKNTDEGKSLLPKHIAIVMDGNGRWAELRGLPRSKGHEAGVESIRRVVNWCVEHEIEVLTLFAFSSENWRRGALEVDFLMELFVTVLKAEIDDLHQRNIKVRIIGDMSSLSSTVQHEYQSACLKTRANTGLTLVIALNYGARWDITQAAVQVGLKVSRGELSVGGITESSFSQELSTFGLCDPDLFIRTAGEVRISNFLLWQLAYTELYFTDVNWPDFSLDDLESAIGSYQCRRRRYGALDVKLGFADA